MVGNFWFSFPLYLLLSFVHNCSYSYARRVRSATFTRSMNTSEYTFTFFNNG